MSQWLRNLALVCFPASFLRKRFVSTSGEINSADRQLLIDVSVISKADAGTGVQRVVCNLYQQLLTAPPKGYKVCAIAATPQRDYCYLPTDFLQQQAKRLNSVPSAVVRVRAGDLFLELDLAAHIIPHRMSKMLRWKPQGVRMCFVVYDLLPVLEPAWFNPKTTRSFRRWLRAVAILADDIISISGTVQAEFAAWARCSYGLNEDQLPCVFIQLGSDLNATTGIPPIIEEPIRLPSQLAEKKFILIVGTIEPRQGHSDVVNAFEKIWLQAIRPIS
jgi:glycosyltransferase involved in cell wall biosynthesis